MKLDTEHEGLRSVFRPYQADLVTRIFELAESTRDWKGWTSAQAYAWNHRVESEDPKSRASIIFFLNDMVDEGFLEYDEKTGKGGYHRVYFPAYNQMAFMDHLTGLFEKKIVELREVWP